MYQKLHDKQWLQEQYIDKRRTLEDIASELGCHKGTVGRALRDNGIKARKRTAKYAQLADYDWLYNAYIVEKRGMTSIAKEVGASVGVVAEHLKQKGIPTRSVREGIANAGRISPDRRLGEKGNNWQGGRRTSGSGYIYVYAPEHPKATRAGCVMEHRLVMEQKLGRYLEPGEVVHHIDGNKKNNAPDNLEVKRRGPHIREHFEAGHEVNGWRKHVEQQDERIKKLEEEVEQLKQQLSKLLTL